MTVEFIPTADLVNEIDPDVRSYDTWMRNLGGHSEFRGKVSMVKRFRDNALLKKILSESFEGGVLVIDDDASIHTALVGDIIAGLGKDNGWAGMVVSNATHGPKLIGETDFGCKALGTNPHKSTKTGEGERDVAASFGGIGFVPGETFYTDSDGIVVR